MFFLPSGRLSNHSTPNTSTTLTSITETNRLCSWDNGYYYGHRWSFEGGSIAPVSSASLRPTLYPDSVVATNAPNFPFSINKRHTDVLNEQLHRVPAYFPSQIHHDLLRGTGLAVAYEECKNLTKVAADPRMQFAQHGGQFHHDITQGTWEG